MVTARTYSADMVKMVLTDNMEETLTIKYDGERFALVHTNKEEVVKPIILNKREAMELAGFIRNVKK